MVTIGIPAIAFTAPAWLVYGGIGFALAVVLFIILCFSGGGR